MKYLPLIIIFLIISIVAGSAAFAAELQSQGLQPWAMVVIAGLMLCGVFLLAKEDAKQNC